MKLIPVMTEKSMKLAKNNGFTFYVPVELTKVQIKNLVEETFSVTVIAVRTINSIARTKKNNRGQTQKIKARKKAMIFLKEGDKIELFEEEKKKKKVAKKKENK